MYFYVSEYMFQLSLLFLYVQYLTCLFGFAYVLTNMYVNMTLLGPFSYCPLYCTVLYLHVVSASVRVASARKRPGAWQGVAEGHLVHHAGSHGSRSKHSRHGKLQQEAHR